MGDAAGERADRFHLVTPAELFFQEGFFHIGFLAGGDVLEDAGELARGRAIGRHFEILVERSRISLKGDRPAGERHLAVGIDPEGFGIRQHLEHGFADQIFGLHSGKGLEGRIDA